jgi:hypothetical protein
MSRSPSGRGSELSLLSALRDELAQPQGMAFEDAGLVNRLELLRTESIEVLLELLLCPFAMLTRSPAVQHAAVDAEFSS